MKTQSALSKQIRRARNRATKQYYCQACDYTAADRRSLVNHYKSKRHLLKAEVTENYLTPDLTLHYNKGKTQAAGVKTKGTLFAQIRHARNRAAKRYYCQACDYTAADRRSLLNHCKSRRHLLKAEATPGFVAPDLTRYKGLTTEERAARKKIVEKENVASKRFYCQTCDYAAPTQSELDRHLKTQSHLNKVAGTVRVREGPGRAERAAQYLAERRYVCDPCNYAASSPQNLARHLSSKRHKKIMAGSSQQLD